MNLIKASNMFYMCYFGYKCKTRTSWDSHEFYLPFQRILNSIKNLTYFLNDLKPLMLNYFKFAEKEDFCDGVNSQL